MIPEQPHREFQLKPFVWTGREAERIAVVCRHSGLFTDSQFCTYLHARPNRACQFVRCLQDRRQAVEEQLGGLPAASPCRISGKGIYRALGIEHEDYRRTASAPVLIRRRLSLDYLLEHPEQPWLTSEQEKVAVFDDLRIPRQAVPHRYYTSNKAFCVRYFALKLPISIGPETVTFVYCRPRLPHRPEPDGLGVEPHAAPAGTAPKTTVCGGRNSTASHPGMGRGVFQTERVTRQTSQVDLAFFPEDRLQEQ